MSDSSKRKLLLICTCALVFFTNLGGAFLFDEDEPKNAECAREMHERGDWIVPTFNYELRTDKPIMIYWLMLTSFQAFGVSEFSVRLPSACMACVTVLCVFAIGRRLFHERIAFWSAIILSSGMMFVASSRISTPDATLIAFITLSLTAFLYSLPKASEISETAGSPGMLETCLPRSNWTWLGIYACMGLAVLTKGPVGFLLPCSIIGLFLMCRLSPPPAPQQISIRTPWVSLLELIDYSASFLAPSRFFAALWKMRPWLIVLAVGSIALPWYVAVGWATNGAWLEGFLGNHNVGRFSSAMEGHSGPFFYYVIAILIGFFPWSVFLPISLMQSARAVRTSEKDRFGLTFLLCWVGVYILFFSIAQTKLPNYVLPCYPALALLTGWSLVRWSEGALTMPDWAFVWGGRSLILAGVGVMIAFPVVSVFLLPGYSAIALAGLLPISVGAWMEWKRTSPERSLPLPQMGLMSVSFCLVVFAGIVPWISRAQESSQIGRAVLESGPKEIPFATYQYFAPNLPFYAARPVSRYHSEEEIRDFWSENPQGLVGIRQSQLDQLRQELPFRTEVIEKSPRFLRPDEIVLIRRIDPVRQIAEQPDDDGTVIR